jgi:hypothetical protein
MGFSLSDLLTQDRSRNAGDGFRWRFEVDRSRAPVRVAWRWERYRAGGLPERSIEAFTSFAECARDAQAHGFGPRHPYTLSDRPRVPASAWAAPREPHDSRPEARG